jgi:periplasmic protein TonB
VSEQQLPEEPVIGGGRPPEAPGADAPHFLNPASLDLPWYKGIIQSIHEALHPPKQAPLEVTSKPLELETSLGAYNGEDPDDHLRHLLAPAAIELPWYKSIVQGIKDLINPPKLPPLEVTSQPVEMASLRGLYGGNETTAGISSVIAHVAVVALLLFVGSLKPVQKAVKEFIPIFAPPLKDFQPKPKPEQSKGGGGSPQKLAATKGELPKVAPKSFIPPIRTVENPKIALTPTIVAPELPNITANNYGDPLGKLGIPSVGNGIGTGIGSGKGPGVGPGSGGGFGGGAYKIGGGVSAPVPVFRPEPEYSEEARKAKWQGAVLLSLVVDENGVPQEIKVVRSLGLGLDQKAIEAVQKWRFKPGLKDGKAVPVSANIEVNFRLL